MYYSVYRRILSKVEASIVISDVTGVEGTIFLDGTSVTI